MDVRSLAADGVDDERVDVTDDRRVVFLDVAALGQFDGQAVVAALAENIGIRSGAADLAPVITT